ncbi:MAG: FtsQ-type POTRA domain-containing protein [Aeromicrobium sp.]|uniref:cell division protein FtsQ/DivIB n=1 Tax=Aeromicrobium sp. TaxID=1871063 RepID=UPI003C4DEB00
MRDRFTERRLDLQRHRWFRILLAVAGALLMGALVWLIWFSSALDARTVSVEGQSSLTAAQVRKAADVPLGGPLARVDLTAIEARVKAVPRIRLVEVSRSWPHGVTIDVTERSAVVWSRVGGEFRGIDRFGVDFRSYRKAPKGLIEARVSATDAEQRWQTLQAVAAIADRIRRDDPGLRKQIQVIIGSTKDSVVLDLTKGRTVTWGSEAQAARKMEVLEQLLEITAKGYDVSAPDQPTTRN